MDNLYFEVQDILIDKRNGERNNAAIVVSGEYRSAEEAERLIIAWKPNYKGRLRLISKEEYFRKYGRE